MSSFINIELGELGTTITGKTPSSDFPEDFGNEYMFITPSDSFDNKTIYETNRYLSGKGLKKLKNKVLSPKSVLVSCIGSAMGKVTMNDSISITNQQINSIIVDSKYDSDYIYYSLKNNYKLLRNASSGSTALPMLNKTDFDKLKITIHKDKITQQRIAKILSDLDAKIDLNNRINTELEAMAKTLYDYWFVQFDFPDANGKPYKTSGGKMVWNEELKREIPEGWEVGNIMTLANLLGGGTPKTDNPNYWSGDIPFFTPADAEDSIYVSNTKQNITEIGLKNSSTKLYSKGTIFITARGTVGKINIASQEMAMNQSCYALQGKENVNCQFLFFYTHELVHYIKSKASGSIFKALVTNDFKFTKMIVPPTRLIQNYGDFSKSIFDKVLNNKLENIELVSLRDWLLPMLMNGQVSVGDVEVELGMVAEEREHYGK